MQIKKREANSVLNKFKFEQRTGKEKVAQFRHKGKWILRTSVPKGRGDLRVSNQFRNQLRLNNDQLKDAIRCPFGYKEYIDHLQSLGIIEK